MVKPSRHRYPIVDKDHEDDEEDKTGSTGGINSGRSKTLAKLKEMGADMKMGMSKLAEKKVRGGALKSQFDPTRWRGGGLLSRCLSRPITAK